MGDARHLDHTHAAPGLRGEAVVVAERRHLVAEATQNRERIAAKRIVPEDMMAMLPRMNALKCSLQPKDLTGTAVFLALEDSDMMTGQVLVVAGGMIMLA